jgi:hypothetical protein
MVSVVSLALKATPSWLVTPEIVISPPLANGLVLFKLNVTELVAGAYETVKLTGFSLVTGFFLTFLAIEESTS